MSRYLRLNREDVKKKIYAKLNMEEGEEVDHRVEREIEGGGSQTHLDRALRETERKKLSIRKLINSANPNADMTDEMAQLRWRIDALKNFSRAEKKGVLNRGTSLTGKQEPNGRELTFDELYEMQKKKFGMLKQRRRSKMTDPKYIEMVGNMQLRMEKRKMMGKSRLDGQMQLLESRIEDKD